jgi:hypothetical protein
MGRIIERRRLQTITYRLSGLTDSTSNGTTSTDLNLPTEVCTGTATTKEQSQRCAFNLVPRMVFNDRPTYKDRHAAELIMARRDISTQRPNTLPQTCLLAQSFSLAVLRRTIHTVLVRSFWFGHPLGGGVLWA